MGRWIVSLSLASCGGESDSCISASELDCGSTSDEPTTCTFRETSASGESSCRALGNLYEALCDEGVRASVSKLVKGTVCEPDVTP